PVQVKVPLEFMGIAPAEKNGLGVLVKVLHEVEIEALPKDLPHSISVDVSPLETLEHQIHVKDLVVSKSITMITAPDEVIALVSAVREEVVEEPAVDLSAIEVEKKGKKDTEEEGGDSKEE